MPNNSDPRQKLIDLAAEHERATARAQELFDKGDREAGKSELTRAQNISSEMEAYKALLQEQTRQAASVIPSAAEARDIAEGRAEMLMRGDKIAFNAVEQYRMLHNAVTLATAGLTEPSGAGVAVNTPVGYGSSAFIDLVRTEDLSGLSGWEEAYMVSGVDAKGGNVKATAGTKRQDSTDAVFADAVIKPYEVTVTSYVDRNINKLTPTRYYERILRDATIAYRKKVNALIFNGDGQPSPDMYGILNATNKAGTRISKDITITALDRNFIENFFYEYGDDDAFGFGAFLAISKPNLRKLGDVVNQNQERIFKTRYEAGKANSGMLDDSGSVTPFVLASALANKVVYGDPQNYMLGIFGDYTVRVDESYMAAERKLTILGDAFVGGNVVVHNGFVVSTMPSAPASAG